MTVVKLWRENPKIAGVSPLVDAVMEKHIIMQLAKRFELQIFTFARIVACGIIAVKSAAGRVGRREVIRRCVRSSSYAEGSQSTLSAVEWLYMI